MENGDGTISGRRGGGALDGGSVNIRCPYCGRYFRILELFYGHVKICCKRTAATRIEDRGILLGIQRRRIGSSEVERSGRLAAYAAEVGDAAWDGGNADGGISAISSVIAPNEDIDAGPSSCKMCAAQSMFTQDLSFHGDPSCPAASPEQLQDVAFSVLPADPENAVRFSSEIQEYEVQTLSAVSLASYAITCGISEQKMVDSELDDIAVAKENGISDAIGKNKPIEFNPVKGDESGLFQQDNQQTKIGEGRSTSLVEEDLSDNNVNVICNEETLNVEIEPKQQSTLNFPIIVGTDPDLLKVGTVSCYSAPEIVEPQQQHNCTTVAEEHLAIPKEADNVYGNPITDGGISAISSVIAPSVDGIVVSVGGAPNIKDNDCLFGAIGDITTRNVITSTSMPSQCELAELMAQNQKVCLCQDKEQNKEVSADPDSPEVIAETSVSTSSSIVLPCEGSTDTLERMRERGVLLETPTGFAVFIVKEPLDTETAWMHFMGIATANMVASLIGFVKLDVKSSTWGEGVGDTSKDLGDLIQKSLKDKKELLVHTKFKDVIEEKFGVTCCDDDGIAGDLIWGLKNVLREFIPEEKQSISKEYYFPLSQGWNDFLLKYSISVPATMRSSYLMSKIFLLRSLHSTLDRVPRNLRESFDKHINGIGNHIKDNFMYALVLARILVPELTPDYNFSKIFSSDMVLKIEEAKRFASNYQEERLTLYDRQIILGALDQLGVVPGQIESVVTFIKLRLKELEVATRRDEEEKMTTWKDGHGARIMQNEKRSILHPIRGQIQQIHPAQGARHIAALRHFASASPLAPSRSDALSTPALTMRPPPVSHPAAGTSHTVPSAESIPPSTRALRLTFRFHPVVVANIIAHYNRVNDLDAYCGDNSSGAPAAQPQRIFGCVIGVQHRNTVDIYNSFELVVDPASGALDRALFEKEQKRYKDLFPNLNVKGWYSSGSHVQDTDMEIHRKFRDFDYNSVLFLLSPTINPSQMYLPMTIYESDLRYINQIPRLIFVRPKHTVKFVKKTLSTEAQSPNHLHVEETASTVIATMPLEEGEDADFKRCAFRRMLFETPSGFAMFGIDDKVFRHPEDIWACFTHLCDAKDVIFTIGFIKFENKSIAWDLNAGPGEDLGNFILKFCNRKGLIVQDLQLKQVIETKLVIQCWFNEQIVPELTWGLSFVLHEFVSEEKQQYYLPLSKELEKKIKAYGFNISKRMIDRDFIQMVGRLKYLEHSSDSIFKFLHDKFDHCFCGIDISSQTEYVRDIENLLSSGSEPSEVMQYEMSVKEDILIAIDSFWAAYRQIPNVRSCLRSMEAAAHLKERASDDCRNSVMGFVKRLPWPAVFTFGCLIAMKVVGRKR